MSTTDRVIKPVRPGGFNDYDPKAMAARRILAERIRVVYEAFGFCPLETPMAEFFEVLTGDEGDNKIWNLTLSKSEHDHKPIALRFDHTVPLARYVAANMTNLELPWRRWCYGPVFRGETTGAGRYHQFYQYDADVVGDPNVTVDAEIIWMMTCAMAELTDHPFMVRWNNRKVINGLAELVGITGTVLDNESGRLEPKAHVLFRILDKFPKIGWDGVATELARKPENKFDTGALQLGANEINLVERYLRLTGDDYEPDDTLAELRDMLAATKSGSEGVVELHQMQVHLNRLAVMSQRMDFSIVRGLGYYTGPVFETTIEGAEQFGSVYSGGRFDGLVGRFTGESLPATGASIGFDRLYAVLEALGSLPDSSASPTRVMIANFGQSRYDVQVFSILASLRSRGIPTELYHEKAPLKAQMARALKLGCDLMIFAGERELSRDLVKIKILTERRQIDVPLVNMVDRVVDLLTL